MITILQNIKSDNNDKHVPRLIPLFPIEYTPTTDNHLFLSSSSRTSA